MTSWTIEISGPDVHRPAPVPGAPVPTTPLALERAITELRGHGYTVTGDGAEPPVAEPQG